MFFEVALITYNKLNELSSISEIILCLNYVRDKLDLNSFYVGIYYRVFYFVFSLH